MLLVDPLRFDRIIDNLITNAAKYTDRGSITVTLDGAPGLLIVRIADTGRGLSPPELRRLFFGRELTAARHSPSGGWGLGLGVVVRLLAELGGELHVESTAGRGSTFEVRLPLAPPAASPSVVRAVAERDERADAAVAGAVAAASLGAPNREERAVDARAPGAARAGVAVVSAEPFDVLCRRVVHVRSAPSAHAEP
jgi:anti-sigma regulatory factor (Ser/Thr protein kinase)